MLIEKDAEYERYKRLRAVGMKLNLEMVRRLPKKDINRCGKELGLLKTNTLVFQVNRTEKGYLCHVEDILRRQDILLMDLGLGSTALTGTLVAARLMKIPASDCYMTTGAPIGVREKRALDVVEWVLSKFTQPIESGNLSRTQANSIGKQVTRALLRVKSKSMILGDPEAHEEALRSGSFKG